MPENFRIMHRARALLSPAITQAEWVGVFAWVFVILVKSELMFDFTILCVTFFLLLVSVLHRVTKVFLAWRFLGVAYIFLLSAGFSFVIKTYTELQIFALPLVVIIVLGCTVLFVNTHDYMISTILAWLLIWPNFDLDIYSGVKIYLALFCVSSTFLGFFISSSYLKNLRSILIVESEFRTLAETDYLTSLPNRRAFMGGFQKVLGDGDAGYLIMLDIDNFKIKNDQYGHDVGDRILCAMAASLKATKGSHSFGRIGGEEFGVIVLGDDIAQATDYALRLLSTIRRSIAPPYQYTCSAGIAKFLGGDEMSVVLKCADINMYKAKQNGKDRVYWDGKRVEL